MLGLVSGNETTRSLPLAGLIPEQRAASDPLALAPEIVAEQPTQKFHGTVLAEDVKDPVKWTMEVPERELAHAGLTLLLPGFGGIKRSSRGERHASAVMGEPSISFEPARYSDSLVEDLLRPQALHLRVATAVLEAAQQRLAEDKSVPFRRRIDSHQVTLSAHSMGGLAAAALALDNASQIEAVIYKATVGFGSPGLGKPEVENALSAIVETGNLLARGQMGRDFRNLLRVSHYYGCNLVRTIGEAASCLTDNATEDVARLNDLGVPTAYLGFEKDAIVPVKLAASNARRVVKKFEVMPGVGHLAPQLVPARVAAKVASLRHEIS